MIRLRQVAMIAPDLDPVVDELVDVFGLRVCFVDPGVAEFGLRNALLLVGDQFLEVLSPIRPGTTVERLLAKRGGPGGYMVIYEVDDLDARIAHLEANDVRVVWAGDQRAIRGRHLHPSDVGGALVSIDEPMPPGSWHWGGPTWPSLDTAGSAVDSIIEVTVGARDREAMRLRWERLGLGEAVRFVGAGDRGEGIEGIALRAVDRSRVGEHHDIGGVRFSLV
jgi:catechol 2,3-dioxygenase-like lactoylglutathione lyase family enzyme